MDENLRHQPNGGFKNSSGKGYEGIIMTCNLKWSFNYSKTQIHTERLGWLLYINLRNSFICTNSEKSHSTY